MQASRIRYHQAVPLLYPNCLHLDVALMDHPTSHQSQPHTLPPRSTDTQSKEAALSSIQIPYYTPLRNPHPRFPYSMAVKNKGHRQTPARSHKFPIYDCCDKSSTNKNVLKCKIAVSDDHLEVLTVGGSTQLTDSLASRNRFAIEQRLQLSKPGLHISLNCTSLRRWPGTESFNEVRYWQPW